MTGKSAQNGGGAAWLESVLPDHTQAMGYELRGHWSGWVPGCAGSGMYLLDEGDVWFETQRRAGWLRKGDVVLMPSVARHRLATDERRPGGPLEHLLHGGCAGDSGWRVGDGKHVVRVHSVRLEGPPLPRVDALPSMAVIPRHRQPPGMRHLIEALRFELRLDGGTPESRHALVRALWLKAMGPRLDDARLDLAMQRAIDAARDRIETVPSVEEMARLAGLSRSRFTERFRTAQGEAPAAWLRRHRMKHAQRLLVLEGLSVAQVAERLGYASESAFRKAYKRVLGRPARTRR